MFPTQAKILVVDDSYTARELIKKALNEIGYQDLYFAADGESAVEILMSQFGQADEIQLVITDMKMPRMDGIQLLNFIRKSYMRPELPFILLTAEGDSVTVAEAIGAKVDAFLLKPLRPDVLRQRLARIWEARKSPSNDKAE